MTRSSTASMRGLIYDLDGTIIDTTELHASGWREAGEFFGVHITDEFLSYQRGKTNEAAVQWLLPEEACARIGKKFIEAKQAFVVSHACEARLFPDFELTLTQLKQRELPVWICTSSPKDFCTAIFARIVQLKPLESSTVYRELYAQSKPSPDALFETFRRMGLQARDCLYIGDTVGDFLAARHASCRFVYYCPDSSTGDARLAEEESTTIADHAEILDLT